MYNYQHNAVWKLPIIRKESQRLSKLFTRTWASSNLRCQLVTWESNSLPHSLKLDQTGAPSVCVKWRISIYTDTPSRACNWTLDRYKIETSSLYLHLHILISNKDMYNGWHSHHSVVGKYSSQLAGEKSDCSVLTFYGHLTSLNRWLTGIVNSTYSTMLNT